MDDALHATRAAVEEGILPGGGVALLRALKALEQLSPDNSDQKAGVDIVRRAIQAPAKQIALNAGDDGSIIVGKLLEKDDYNWGYNAATGEYQDLVGNGVIDPAKVVRTALQDAASVAALLITTEALIAEKPKKEAAPALPAGAGMDF
ncbi:60 kDa chaperonin 5 [compost metagenome]